MIFTSKSGHNAHNSLRHIVVKTDLYYCTLTLYNHFVNILPLIDLLFSCWALACIQDLVVFNGAAMHILRHASMPPRMCAQVFWTELMVFVPMLCDLSSCLYLRVIQSLNIY